MENITSRPEKRLATKNVYLKKLLLDCTFLVWLLTYIPFAHVHVLLYK